jgi:hypothetical protein
MKYLLLYHNDFEYTIMAYLANWLSLGSSGFIIYKTFEIVNKSAVQYDTLTGVINYATMIALDDVDNLQFAALDPMNKLVRQYNQALEEGGLPLDKTGKRSVELHNHFEKEDEDGMALWMKIVMYWPFCVLAFAYYHLYFHFAPLILFVTDAF